MNNLHDIGGKVHLLAQITFASCQLSQDEMYNIKLLSLQHKINDIPCMTSNSVIVTTPRQDSGSYDPIDDTWKR